MTAYAFPRLVVEQTDNLANNYLKSLYGKLLDLKLEGVDGHDLVLQNGKDFVPVTATGNTAFFGWNSVKDRVFETVDPVSGLFSDLISLRTKTHDGKLEGYKRFVTDTGTFYKNVVTNICISLINTVSIFFYAAAYLGSTYQRPMRKAWTVSNAFYGVLKLFADIISMSLVLVSSLVNFALTLGIDTVKFASGWLLKPLSAVLNYYIGKEQEQVKDEQLKADKDKAIESAEAIAKANIETWLVERSEIKNLRAEVKEEVPAEVEVEVEEEPAPEVKEPTLDEQVAAKQAEIEAKQKEIDSSKDALIKDELFDQEKATVKELDGASDEDKAKIEAFNKLSEEMEALKADLTGLDKQVEERDAKVKEEAEKLASAKAELEALTADIVKAPEAKEGEEVKEADADKVVEFKDGVAEEQIKRYEELKAMIEPKVEEVAEESKAEESEAEDAKDAKDADKADEKDATKEKEVVTTKKTVVDIVLNKHDTKFAGYLRNNFRLFKPAEESVDATADKSVDATAEKSVTTDEEAPTVTATA